MNRIAALDFTRVVAMLSVIIIHVTSTFIYSSSNFTILNMNLAFIMNQATRYAVPLFIVISGISLKLNNNSSNVFSFWKARIIKIGIPYLIWYFVYDLYNFGFDISLYVNTALRHPARFMRSLFLGQSAPHLYFIIILIQLYILYPFMSRLIEKAPTASIGISFISTFFVNSLYVFSRNGLNLIPAQIRPFLWLLFPTWLFYFVIGTAISTWFVTQFKDISSQKLYVILGATVLYSIVFVIDAQLTKSLDSMKPSLMIYTLLILVTSYAIGDRLRNLQTIQLITNFLSRHSMSIYFCHVLILSYLRRTPLFTTGMRGMVLLLLAVILMSVIFSAAIDWVGNVLNRRFRHT